ncbi:MAG: hypothetical protein H3Z53_05890 [archaeon]|nr:hypothetical protein [archaeon]MCP8313886.1 hypothetical protein [archaeon]
MLKIELGDLKDKSEDLANFLEKKLKLKPSIEVSSLVFDDTKLKVKLKKSLLKTYLKRYLHINDLRKSYRVLVKEDELKLVALKAEEEG